GLPEHDRHRVRLPDRRRRAPASSGGRAGRDWPGPRPLLPLRHAAAGAAAPRVVRALMLETLSNLGLGFSVALSPPILMYAFVGCLVGTLVGVPPGRGPLARVS